MSAVDAESDWIELGTVPAKMELQQDPFTIVYNEKQNSLFLITKSQTLPEDMLLFQYSFKTNSWSKYLITPSIKGDLAYLLNKPMLIHGNKIYICCDDNPKAITILTIGDNNHNFAKLQQKQTSLDLNRDLIDAKAIMIRDQVHIIGGEGGKHLKHDPIPNSVETLHDDFWDIFNEAEIYAYGIAKLKDKIIIIGGNNGFDNVDIHHEYDINQNKWSRIDCKLPQLMNGFGCTKILNGQFLALFGGFAIKHDGNDIYEGEKGGDDIFIYSVKKKVFKKSKIKCPNKGGYQAITFCDRKQDKTVTFGYVRSMWLECVMEDHLFPPEYLIRIMFHYYWNECIHLFRDFSDNYKCGEHHKIDALKLLLF